jgi:hypothetical protein
MSIDRGRPEVAVGTEDPSARSARMHGLKLALSISGVILTDQNEMMIGINFWCPGRNRTKQTCHPEGLTSELDP